MFLIIAGIWIACIVLIMMFFHGCKSDNNP